MEMFNYVCYGMIALGAIVFVSLYFVDAGYGKMISSKWGPAINNKIGWMIMECPVFFVLLYYWAKSPVRFDVQYLLFFLFFEFHYLHRTFIAPFLMRGNSKMPWATIIFSIIFNLINGYMQGKWLFELAPQDPQYQMLYSNAWLSDPRFIIGTVIFFVGMAINWHSDYTIRHLRKPGDSKHYLPKGGLYNYVTSANYFGEIIEWMGWAILTWSLAGFVFFWFTMSNLVPRAHRIYDKYKIDFATEFAARKPKLKRIVPFIY